MVFLSIIPSRPRITVLASRDIHHLKQARVVLTMSKRQRDITNSLLSADEEKPVKKCRRTPATSETEMGAVIQFYSKSKDCDDLGSLGEGPEEKMQISNWRKILSNFHPSVITVQGNTFPSVEHYFHAAKYMCSNRPDYAKELQVGGSVGSQSPLEAKRAGSKSGMTRVSATLDVRRWNHTRDKATARALKILSLERYYVKRTNGVCISFTLNAVVKKVIGEAASAKIQDNSWATIVLENCS